MDPLFFRDFATAGFRPAGEPFIGFVAIPVERVESAVCFIGSNTTHIGKLVDRLQLQPLYSCKVFGSRRSSAGERHATLGLAESTRGLAQFLMRYHADL
jgi:hypothetical protein